MDKFVRLFYYTLGFIYVFMILNKWFSETDCVKTATPRIKFSLKYWYWFFTAWNAVSCNQNTLKYIYLFSFLQILHLVYTILRIIEFQCEKQPSIKFVYKKLVLIRSFLYVQFMFPTTVAVSSIFWSLYHIDRNLIYPPDFDSCIEPWENHVLHTSIVLPLVVDLFLSSNPILLPNHKNAALTFLIYGATYQTGLVIRTFNIKI